MREDFDDRGPASDGWPLHLAQQSAVVAGVVLFLFLVWRFNARRASDTEALLTAVTLLGGVALVSVV